jgi:hypothetical protein
MCAVAASSAFFQHAKWSTVFIDGDGFAAPNPVGTSGVLLLGYVAKLLILYDVLLIVSV